MSSCSKSIFGKTPVVTLPVPIKQASASTGLIRLPRAYAAENPSTYGHYEHSDRYQGNVLIRQRRYTDGATQEQVIDPRTGQIVRQSSTPATKQPAAQQQQVTLFAGIDLNLPRPTSQEAASSATLCATSAGQCTLVQPMAPGTRYYWSTPGGAVLGGAR